VVYFKKCSKVNVRLACFWSLYSWIRSGRNTWLYHASWWQWGRAGDRLGPWVLPWHEACSRISMPL